MSEPSEYDVVVLGTGSGGKLAAIELAKQGRRVLAVEATRFGGACPYVACVPAKSLLLSGRSGLSWADAVARRDEASDGRDDGASLRSLTDEGVDVLRGRGQLQPRVDGKHRVVVEGADGGRRGVAADVVVLATGSVAETPPVEGIGAVPTWTSEEALSSDERPDRLLVLGGGAVGCELAQAYAQLGAQVTLVEVAGGLLPGEAPWVGDLVADVLRDSGVEVLVATSAERVEPLDGGRGLRLHLASGAPLTADRLLVAGGRAPRSGDLGLEHLDVRVEESGAVAVDARCQALGRDGEPIPGLYAVGDLTEPSSYTHSANYQARIVAAQVDGHGHDADYVAVPRAVYLDPAVFCVGLTADQARERGIDVRTAGFDVSEIERATLAALTVPPPGTKRQRGRVELVADASTGVLVGAACVGPEADSWGAELALAVRARLDVRLLAEHIRAFPTWSEAVYPAACRLAADLP